MRVKVIKSFIGRKSERPAGSDSSVIEAGTYIDVDINRAAYLQEVGYVEAPANKAKKFKKK